MSSKKNSLEQKSQKKTLEFAALFVLFVMLFLVSILATNWVVNPYGDYSTSYFRPLVQQSRDFKADLIQSAKPGISGVVLGSSRVMQLSPAQLEEMSGHSFLNLGVNSGGTTDFLALTRYFEKKLSRFPKILVIGLDVECFSESRPIDARLLANSDLMSLIGDRVGLGDRFKQYQNVLSFGQLMASIKSAWYSLADRFPRRKTRFRKDGTIEYLGHKELVEEKTFDLALSVAKDRDKHIERFHGFYAISIDRLQELRILLETCQKNNSTVIVFLTPFHPSLIRSLEKETRFQKIKVQLIEKIDELNDSLDFEFHDFTHLENFGGDPADFNDSVHYLESNARQIIKTMFRERVWR